jgi:hypothetical protein
MRRHPDLAACLLLGAMALALLTSIRSESPTTDEPLHLTRGIAFFWGPDRSLSYAHPPLGDAIAALPVALSERPISIRKLDGWKQRDVDKVARALLIPDYEHRRSWFFEARTSMAVLTLALGVYVYLFSRKLWGIPTALAALAFFALHPTLVAHGRLVTTDMPMTASMFVSVGELLLFLNGGSRWRVLSASGMTGVALATKYTALVLGPIFAVWLGVAASFGLGRYAGRPRGRALAEATAVLLAIGLMSLLVINASYRFDHTGMRRPAILRMHEPQNAITARYHDKLLEHTTWVRRLPKWLPVPVPYTYLFGLASIGAHVETGHSTVFFGEYLKSGSRFYFPTLLTIKTPFLMLVALGLGLYLVLRERARPTPVTLALVSFIAALLLIACGTSLNIGVRHVLPVFPALAVLAGRSVHRVFESPLAAGAPAFSLPALLALHASGMLWAFPDYLSDFNVLVGGKAGGERISIVGEEWGQDMIRLGKAAEPHHIEQLYYVPDMFTAALELNRFGIEVEKLNCSRGLPDNAYIAVNARDRARNKWGCFGWTRQRQSLLNVGEHVWVYHTENAHKTKPKSKPNKLKPKPQRR